MKQTGKEFQARLSLARAEHLAHTIEKYRQAQIALGTEVKLEILATPGCSAAQAQAGKAYSLDGLPILPIPGCNKTLGCGCCYSPIS
jgi:hypothetical protein